MLEYVLISFVSITFTVYFYLINKFNIGFNKIRAFNTHQEIKLQPVSCIIPFRNEEKNLSNLINSLLNQELSNKYFEVILVDDFSTDNSFLQAQNLIAQTQHFHVIKNKIPGKKNAINLGIRHSKYKYLVTTDADCIHTKKWLYTISQFISTNKPDIIIGPVTLNPINNFFEQFQAIDFLSLVTTGAGASEINKPIMCNAANLVYSKDLYQAASSNIMNQYASGDDIFLLQYANSIHAKIQFLKNENSIVCTDPVKTFSEFMQQRARWASKSKGYKDQFTLWVAWIVFLTNTLITFIPFSIFISKKTFLLSLILFSLKLLFDYKILKAGASFFKSTFTTITFLKSQIIYPFYIFYTVIYAAFGNVTWKDRKIIS